MPRRPRDEDEPIVAAPAQLAPPPNLEQVALALPPSTAAACARVLHGFGVWAVVVHGDSAYVRLVSEPWVALLLRRIDALQRTGFSPTFFDSHESFLRCALSTTAPAVLEAVWRLGGRRALNGILEDLDGLRPGVRRRRP